MGIPITQVDALTGRAFAGIVDPAAVCLLAAPAEEPWMQAGQRVGAAAAW